MDYTKENLDALRLEGDPLADNVIAQLVAAGQIQEVNRIMRSYDNNDQEIPSELPSVVQEYLRLTDNPPAWADPERISRAYDFFVDDGLRVSAVLSIGAMVGCYAVPQGAKLMAATHRLSYPHRRMAETGQFCFHLMEKNPFGAGGKFVPSIQKVRLIHAAVRHFLRQDDARWDEATLGVPICQEDLLGALMLFSSQVLKGMERLGVPATPQEADDYYYVWLVTGVMMGIREDIIPQTLEEAYAFNKILENRHLAPSPEGIELTHNLIKLYEDMVPGKIFDGVVPSLIRYVLEDKIADYMEVPRSKWAGVVEHLPKIGNLLEETEDYSDLARKILDKAASMILQGQMRMFTGDKPVEFDIPPDLRKGWEARAVSEQN